VFLIEGGRPILMNSSAKEINQSSYGKIAVLLVGAFVAILNSTLLNVAMPSMMVDLQVGATTIQWLATGYMLVNGILIPSTAYLIQKYSVRTLFITAMLLIILGTIVSSSAHRFPNLLVGRMIQASGSAVMMPLLMNVILSSFPIHKRGRAMGYVGLVMVFAPAIGPTLSGWIVEHYHWRTLFYMIIPIALLVLLLSFFFLNDKKESVQLHLDKRSLIFSSIGFGAILFGFSSAGDRGWASPVVYVNIFIGTVTLLLFVWRQFNLDEPFLDFRIYRYPMFALASAISIVLNMALFSAMILMPIYLQQLREISPMASGLLLLPGAVIMGIMSPITGKIFDLYGARILGIIGLTLTVTTTYFFSKLTVTTSYLSLLVIYSLRMFGMSMVMMPVMTNGLNQLPPKMNPHGTAMNSTLSQVSGAIGSALLITVMSIRTKIHGEELLQSALGALTEQPNAEEITEINNQISAMAMMAGINDAFYVATFIAGIALLLAFFIKNAKPNRNNRELEWERGIQLTRNNLKTE
jgi:EmrB/QacA subfamily drug resistance transporter